MTTMITIRIIISIMIQLCYGSVEAKVMHRTNDCAASLVAVSCGTALHAYQS